MTDYKPNQPPRQPDFKGDGIAVWINRDKNNNQYLSVKLLGSINLAAFKNKPKPTPPQQPTTQHATQAKQYGGDLL